jgi:hypothetical protein
MKALAAEVTESTMADDSAERDNSVMVRRSNENTYQAVLWKQESFLVRDFVQPRTRRR